MLDTYGVQMQFSPLRLLVLVPELYGVDAMLFGLENSVKIGMDEVIQRDIKVIMFCFLYYSVQ